MPTTSNFGWTTPADTDLVKDGAAAIRTLGNGIDTSLVDLKGGTTGQILSKASNTDLDYTWITNDVGDITAVTAGTGISGGGTSGAVTITNDMATTITASGDIVLGTGSGTYDNLPIGTTGQVLTADTTVSPYKVKWATPAAGGKVLQVVTGTTTTNFTTSSTTYGDTNLSATITPSATSSKVLVLVSQQFYMYRAASEMGFGLRILRGATAIHTAADIAYIQTTSGTRGDLKGFAAMIYVDSPSTTSATTYKTQGNVTYTTSSAGVSIQDGAAVSTITLLEIGA